MDGLDVFGEKVTLTLVVTALTFLLLVWDLISRWLRDRPRMRLRIWKSAQDDELRLIFINRGGSSYSVVGITTHFQHGDGDWGSATWGPGPEHIPFSVIGRGAEVKSPDTQHVSEARWLEIESVPRGVLYFPVPERGWQSAHAGRITRLLTMLRFREAASARVTRELKGQHRRPVMS